MPEQKACIAFMNIYRFNKPLPNYRMFIIYVKNNINNYNNKYCNKSSSIKYKFA